MLHAPDRVVSPSDGGNGGPPRTPGAASTRSIVGGLAAAAAAMVAWLALRPSDPHGVAAVVDLVVLPAVVFGGVRLAVGRPRLAPSTLGVFFGLGAVFSAVTSLLAERAAGLVFGSGGISVSGPLIESAAVCVPVVVVVILADRRAWNLADATLAALASGLGLLVVQTSLATAATHVAPDYVSPLLAGLQRVPPSAGSPATYFAGHALAAALVGVALGLGLRLRRPLVRPLPAAAALALVVFDRQLFDWRLRHLVTARPARSSGLVDALQRVSLHGRLALVLLAAGLLAARLTGQRPPPSVEVASGAAGAGTEAPAIDEPVPDEPVPDAPVPDAPVPDAPVVIQPAEAADAPDADTGVAPKKAQPAWTSWAPSLVAAGAGVAVTLLARGRHLGVLDSRALALAVSAAGLAYSLWHLPDVRRSSTGPDQRLVLGVGAVLSSAAGVVASLLPGPHAAVPVHGGLVLETVLGWGAHVGNVGLVLGLGGLAAPQGERGRRLFGDRWGGAVRRRLGWTGWWGPEGRRKAGFGPGAGLARHGRRGRDGRSRHRLERSGHGGEFLWFKLSNGRWSKGRNAGQALTPEGLAAASDRAVAIAIEPVHVTPGRQLEFTGATVQEALAAAMRHVGADLAHSSLQLVDDGRPGKSGKAGTARPARVRVTEARADADDELVPPARDSITRTTPFVVVVDLAHAEGEEPPQSVNVTIRSSMLAGSRTLACAQVETSAGRATYRSNPYSIAHGEQTSVAGVETGGPAAPGGLRVPDGGEIAVELRGERTTLTVYDGWASQVVGVNRHLLDLTEEDYRRVLAVLEEEAERMDRSGQPSDGVRRSIRRLQVRLASVDHARRLLAKTDPAGDVVSQAFLSSAALHVATSVADDDGALDRAAAALRAVPAATADEGSPDPAKVAFRRFLMGTGPGVLWSEGAYSVHDVARLLGWERFADDPAGDSPAPPTR